jgi:hypothetical protein
LVSHNTSASAPKGEFRIPQEPVEEVLGVEEHAQAGRPE